MSFEPNIAGGRVPARVDEPLEWPLLARLPFAGRGAISPQPAPAPRSPHAQVAPSAVSPAIDLLNRRPTANLRSQHAVGSSPRVVPEAYEWPELEGGAAPTERPPAPRREYLRIDAADGRLGRGTSRRPANHSLAARAYRWHAALAPHAGVAATVVLILSATLLYWLTLGQGRTGGAYENILDRENSWSNDAPLESKIAVHQQEADASGPSFDLTPPSSEFPRVAKAAAEPTLSAAQPTSEAPIAAPAAPAADEPPSTDNESAAITPTPHTAPYPVTEYVSLDLALADAVEPVAAAEPVAAKVAAEPAAGAIR